jgi:hypothetical protein
MKKCASYEFVTVCDYNGKMVERLDGFFFLIFILLKSVEGRAV